MMSNYTGYGWNSWMLILILIWPLMIAAAVWAVLAITRVGPARRTEETPLQTLTRRFANGEITQQEYLDTRAILKNGPRHDVQAS